MPTSEDRPFTAWEALGVLLAGLPWRTIITTLLATTAAVGGNQAVQTHREQPRIERSRTWDKVNTGAIMQMQQEIALLQAQVDSLKQGR